MYINNIGFIPIGTYQYNGFTWIVGKNTILKSLPFYSDKFIKINQDDIVSKLELAGLYREIRGK